MLAVVTPAQDLSTPQAALARAQLLEQQEGDLAQAEQAYRALLAAPDAAAVHGAVALRLGKLLWRLERREEAQPLLAQAVAAGGDIAAQAQALLQGQGPDAQQEAARKERAQMLITRLGDLLHQRRDEKGNLIDADRSSRVEQELDALGATAAEALAEFLQKDVPLQWADGSPDHYVRALSAAAWRIGHPPAQQVLMGIADTGSVERRVFHAECATRTKIAADMEPVLLRFATAPDPTGEVWPHVANAFGQLNVARLGSLIENEAVGIRAAALSALAGRWTSLPDTQRNDLIRERSAAIRTATRATDRRLRGSAWQLIDFCLRAGPTAGTFLFLAEIEHAPTTLASEHSPGWPLLRDDAWLQAAAAAAKRMGPFPAENHRVPGPQATLLRLLRGNDWSGAPSQRTRASVDAAITLLDLGYGVESPSWLTTAGWLADEEQFARMIATTPRIQGPWMELFTTRRLPASALPTLQNMVADQLRGGSTAFARQMESRSVRGVSRGVITKVSVPMLHWAAGTQRPEVAIWLGELAAAEPTLAHHCASLLADLADAKVVEALPPLRTMLVWEGNEENELNETERNRIFAALTKAGDVEAIPLFPRAYELGLASGESSDLRVGINFLCEGHGYQGAALRQCWQTLLDSAAAPRVLADLASRLPETQAPALVLDLIADHLATFAATRDEQNSKHKLPKSIGAAFGQLTKALPEGSPLHAAMRRMLGASEPEPGLAVFPHLRAPVARQFAAEGLAILRRTNTPGMIEVLVRNGIELTVDDWRVALQSENMRVHALQRLPTGASANGALRADIEALLTDRHEGIRSIACDTMQRLFGSDAVPALLPLLQDRDEDVRKRARAALDQLRQDAEQRAFWSEAGTGIDLRPQAAASRLLQQAKAGEPKEQRLLAVRSLAILGAAEALPYLIDLTKDQDQELAAAARAAIAAIHQRGAVPGTTK